MRSVQITLAAGLAVIVVVVVGVLSQHPLVVLAMNSGSTNAVLALPWKEGGVCQAGERLPRGTTAVRLTVNGAFGPEVTLRAIAGTRILTSGEQHSGWTGQTLTIPVHRVSRAAAHVRICVVTGHVTEGVALVGSDTGAAVAAHTYKGQALPGRLGIEYLGNSDSSWLARASSIAGHMALGRAWSGVWVVFLVAGLMLAAATLASWLAFHELGRVAGNARPAMAACAVVACMNAASWSFITPPFQVPDEPSHFAYVKQLADTGGLPTSSAETFSEEEMFALRTLRYQEIRQNPSHPAIFTAAYQNSLDVRLQELNRSSGSGGSPAAGVATAEPPLYYALESIPYHLGTGGTLLDRLQLMRLLSALLAGLTALCTFLFLRETLPSVRWAWTVGTLGVALSPLFAFMSGSVNPDALLFTVSAALFYCIARAFRRGLTTRSASAIGLIIAAGFLTKLNFIGLAPGALIGILALQARRVRNSGGRALRTAALAIAIGCAPIAVFVVRNALLHRRALGIVSATISTTHGSILAAVNYIWQLYLPRLPGTVNDFPGLFAPREIWLDGYVGKFGWFDTLFPGWVYTLALLPAGLIAMLCARTLIAHRTALRTRVSELVVYLLMALGLLVLIGVESYRRFPQLAAEFGQARYLLPLLPLLATGLALAARGAGRRWGVASGALLITLFLAHDLVSQLQVIARYYG